MAETGSREAIAADYQAARETSDTAAMRRFQNEEACLVLLAILERLAAEPATFIHHVFRGTEWGAHGDRREGSL